MPLVMYLSLNEYFRKGNECFNKVELIVGVAFQYECLIVKPIEIYQTHTVHQMHGLD